MTWDFSKHSVIYAQKPKDFLIGGRLFLWAFVLVLVRLMTAAAAVANCAMYLGSYGLSTKIGVLRIDFIDKYVFEAKMVNFK